MHEGGEVIDRQKENGALRDYFQPLQRPLLGFCLKKMRKKISYICLIRPIKLKKKMEF